MSTKTVLEGAQTEETMNAFIGILQVLIRDVGVTRVHATGISYHHSPV
jgi:hypothetical protein